MLDNSIAAAQLDESEDFFRNPQRCLIYLLRCICFKAVIQSVLLFGEETWAVNPPMGWVLRSLQDQVERRLTGELPQQSLDGRWEYILAELAREEAGFELMEIYIRKSHNTVAHYIATPLILDLCKATERKQGDWVGIRRREQE